METYIVDLPVVTGTATAQALIVTEVPLAPPAHRLERVDREVAVDRCTAEDGRVTITGRLIHSITYKSRRKGGTKAMSGARRVTGGLVNCSVEIPFHLWAPVAEARMGDLCGPLRAVAERAHEELTAPAEDGTFRSMLIKSVARVQVRVVRHKMLRIDGVEVLEERDDPPTPEALAGEDAAPDGA